MSPPDDLLADYALAQGLPWDDRAAERFARYADLLEQFNAKMNLIGPMDREAIVRTLLRDSAVAAACAPPRGRMLDVGSGAGLPGLPLAILYPEVDATLVEPRGKRATFIKIAAKRLGLERVRALNARLEEVAPGRYDYVVSKAFRPPVEWLTAAAPWRSEDGVVVCMTRASERAELDARAAELGLAPAGEAPDPEPPPEGMAPRWALAYGPL
jgi:16S rRNA (guanine527-N7)-methyltransferase